MWMLLWLFIFLVAVVTVVNQLNDKLKVAAPSSPAFDALVVDPHGPAQSAGINVVDPHGPAQSAGINAKVTQAVPAAVPTVFRTSFVLESFDILLVWGMEDMVRLLCCLLERCCYAVFPISCKTNFSYFMAILN